MSQLSSLLNALVLTAIIGAAAYCIITPQAPKDPKGLSQDQHFADQISKPGTVLVKFGAPWCPPCRNIERELDMLTASSASQVSVVKIDVDQNRPLAAHYGVSSIPHLILFKNGKQVAETKGFHSCDQLKVWIANTH